MNHKIAAGVVLLGLFASDLEAQTIADVARQERARRARVQTSTVITNAGGRMPARTETMPATPPAPVVTPSVVTPASAASAPSTAPQPAGPTDRLGRDETFWRAAFEKARGEVTRAEQRLALIQLRINQLQSAIMMNAAMYNRENRIGPELTAAQADFEATRAEVEAAKRRLLDLEEDLRRSGGLPGWAR